MLVTQPLYALRVSWEVKDSLTGFFGLAEWPIWSMLGPVVITLLGRAEMAADKSSSGLFHFNYDYYYPIKMQSIWLVACARLITVGAGPDAYHSISMYVGICLSATRTICRYGDPVVRQR